MCKITTVSTPKPALKAKKPASKKAAKKKTVRKRVARKVAKKAGRSSTYTEKIKQAILDEISSGPRGVTRVFQLWVSSGSIPFMVGWLHPMSTTTAV